MGDKDNEPGPSLNVTRDSLLKKCVKCFMVIVTKEFFKCWVCSGLVHVSCAPGTYDKNSIASINKNFQFMCFKCSDRKYEIMDMLNNLKTVETECDKLRNVHNVESHEFIKTIQTQKSEINNQKVINAELQRQIHELQKQVQEQHAAKRPRTEMESGPTDNEYISTNLKAIIETTLNPLVDKVNKLSTNYAQLNVQISKINKNIDSIGQLETKPYYGSNSGQNIKRRYFEECPTESYAHAVSKSNQSIETIRNITLCDPGDPNKDCTSILAQLQKDDLCSSDNIKSIKAKGKCSLTVTCKDIPSTERVETKLKNKYKESINIKKVEPSRPMIKIIRIHTDIENDLEIIQQIKEQNEWLLDSEFQIKQKYEVVTINTTYKNIIITCDLPVHELFLEYGSIIFGFKESRCVEHVDLIQCKNCARFGHFIHSCTFKTRCKKCTGEHLTKDCKITEKFTCSNCSTIFKNDESINKNHHASDSRCIVRKERICALKKIFLQQIELAKN